MCMLTVDSFKKQRDEVLMEKRMKKDESEAVEEEIAEEQVLVRFYDIIYYVTNLQPFLWTQAHKLGVVSRNFLLEIQ